MLKNSVTISSFGSDIASGSNDTCDLVNTPRDIQFDVEAALTLASGTIAGNIVIQLITVDSSGNEYLPAESDDNRTITILSDNLTAGAVNYFSKGIDRVAGASNVKFKVSNDSGVVLSATTITLGKLQF